MGSAFRLAPNQTKKVELSKSNGGPFLCASFQIARPSEHTRPQPENNPSKPHGSPDWCSPTRRRPLLLPSPRTGCRHLVAPPSRSPPFLRHFFLAGFLANRCHLGFSSRLCHRLRPF